MIRHALTFDVEEYFHVHAYSNFIDPTRWDSYPSRVEIGMRIILEMLAAANTHATFFVLGWVAQRNPGIVRAIVDAGHELASHGYNHRRVDQQTPLEFRLDIRHAKGTLEQIAGVSVTAYRAPSFSIAPWANKILVEEGYSLDSSSRYTTSPYLIETPSGVLTEFPLPSISFAGRKFGLGGGGYFRLFPTSFTFRGIRAADQAGRPFCVYLHPWEFDPDQPRITSSMVSTFRHRVGLSRTETRLSLLLQSLPFDTLTKSLSSVGNLICRSSDEGQTFAADSNPRSLRY